MFFKKAASFRKSVVSAFPVFLSVLTAITVSAEEEPVAQAATDSVTIDPGGMLYTGIFIGTLPPGSWRDRPSMRGKTQKMFVLAGNPETFNEYPAPGFWFTFLKDTTPAEKLDSLTPGQPTVFSTKSPGGYSLFDGRYNAWDLVLQDVRFPDTLFYSTPSYARYPDGINGQKPDRVKNSVGEPVTGTSEKTGYIFEVLRRKTSVFFDNECYFGFHRGGKDYFEFNSSFFNRIKLESPTDSAKAAHMANVIWFVTTRESVCRYAEDAATTLQKLTITFPVTKWFHADRVIKRAADWEDFYHMKAVDPHPDFN